MMAGRRGPAKQPTALKLVHGNPGRRPINASEPKPRRQRPARPAWLIGDARKAWEELVPLLDQMGVLTIVDRRALARYCKLWARWVALTRVIEKTGEVYPIRGRPTEDNPQGAIVSFRTFPQVKIIESLSAELRQLEREFGLTPSARSSIEVEKRVAPQSKLEGIIARGRASRGNPTAG